MFFTQIFKGTELISDMFSENILFIDAGTVLQVKGPNYILGFFQSYYIILNSFEKTDAILLFTCLCDVEQGNYYIIMTSTCVPHGKNE